MSVQQRRTADLNRITNRHLSALSDTIDEQTTVDLVAMDGETYKGVTFDLPSTVSQLEAAIKYEHVSESDTSEPEEIGVDVAINAAVDTFAATYDDWMDSLSVEPSEVWWQLYMDGDVWDDADPTPSTTVAGTTDDHAPIIAGVITLFMQAVAEDAEDAYAVIHRDAKSELRKAVARHAYEGGLHKATVEALVSDVFNNLDQRGL
jgi:hypothetical protein